MYDAYFLLLRETLDDLDYNSFLTYLSWPQAKELTTEEVGDLVFDLLTELYTLIDYFDCRFVESYLPMNQNVKFPIVHRGMQDILRILCKKEPAVLTAQDNSNNDVTALLMAVSSWPKEICETMIIMGANIKEIDSYGRNIIHYAAKNTIYGNDIIRWVVTNYPEVEFSLRDMNLRTPMMMAGTVEIMKTIREVYPQQCSPTDRDMYGSTVLNHIVTRYSHRPKDLLPMIAYLLENGVDINDNNNLQKQTALMLMCYYHIPNRIVIDYMIRKFADIDAKDVNGWDIERYLRSGLGKHKKFEAKTYGLDIEVLVQHIHRYFTELGPQIQKTLLEIQHKKFRMNLLRTLYKTKEELPFDLVLKITESSILSMYPRIKIVDDFLKEEAYKMSQRV